MKPQLVQKGIDMMNPAKFKMKAMNAFGTFLRV